MSDSSTAKRTRNGEQVLVDFVANFVAGGEGSFEPVKGRVLMSPRQLILATSNSKTVVPLTSVYDVAVGQVPNEVEQFFDHTVMVGYVVDGTQRTTVVGGSRDRIEKFSLLLYRATLRGSTVSLKHPAQIGGRVTDEPLRDVSIHLDTESVAFPGTEDLTVGEDPFEIDLANVIFFEVIERTVQGEKRLVLSVRHVDNGQTVTTEVSMGSRRKMNILGRYIRQMYHYLTADVRNVDLDEATLEVLVGIYSTGGGVDLGAMLDLEQAELDAHLESLHDEGLIDEESQACELTPQGQFVVNEEIEDVNM